MKGTVTWYNITEGCGSFQSENGKQIRFYRNVLPVGTFLNTGDLVEFEIEGSKRGLQAKDVKKLE
jgi:cold shock CspA family protein